MPELRTVTLTARQPLSLGLRHNPGTALLRTHRHIRGTALRGALAQAWIAAHGTPDELAASDPPLHARFVELFERHVRYGPLFPTGWALVPLSVRRCKYRAENACSSWSVDEALLADDTGTNLEECAVCGGPAELSKGQLESFGGPPGRLLRQSTHVELNEYGVAVKGQLFTREAIRARDDNYQPRIFTGQLTLPDDLSEAARDWLTAERSIRVGGRGSTSGLSVIASSPATPPPVRTAELLALRFTSPALLVDSSGLPLLHPAEDELSTLLDTDVTVKRRWVRHERVGGWNRATNLPKPEELAVSAGTVYLLRCTQAPAPQRVRALCDAGLGMRRNEGFGALQLDTEGWSAPAYSPAKPDGATATPARDSEAARTARTLNATDHGPWLLTNLSAYARERATSARPPYTELLAATKLRDLRPSDRATLERLLLHPDPRLLDEVLRHLELLVRRADD